MRNGLTLVTRVMFLAILATFSFGGSCAESYPYEFAVEVEFTDKDEAWKIAQEVLTAKYNNDLSTSDKDKGLLVSGWDVEDNDMTEHLVRKRASIKMTFLGDYDFRFEFDWDREISTKKDAFGELDTVNPNWISSSDAERRTRLLELMDDLEALATQITFE